MALWLVITGSALGTGVILWLLKLLIDAASDTVTEQPPTAPAAPDRARPIEPPFPAPHAHTTACTGETLTLTTLQPHRARHAKPRNAA
ncbi:hypothetical protein [Streptomyces scabiei]|uniref:hypothetical protein n=1 Tax=Streptomyces scabiei TaxID=1930 RepID=UPI001B30F0E3|nr:hypothetical protein [Streptomyces sp. LBUM 1475]QTU64267.1 hypothetical protein F3K22_27530 [Streptomyces sp. LBUM 1475]